MKKLKIKIVSLFLALFFSSTLLANEEIPDTQKYFLNWTQMPVVCSSADNINRYLEDYGFKIKHVSVGRENAKLEGKPVYLVGFFINDNNESIPVLSVPGAGSEVCMIYRTFNLIEYDSENAMEFKEDDMVVPQN
jgi:hypothetical protein